MPFFRRTVTASSVLSSSAETFLASEDGRSRLTSSIVILLEQNHSLFSSIIVVGNEVPYVKPALLSGLAIVIGSYLTLRFTGWGIMGLILVQGVCQLAYNNWKWPLVVCRDFRISFPRFLQVGMQESLKKAGDFLHHRL